MLDPVNSKIEAAQNWCKSNIGVVRIIHPIHEARVGYLGFHKGNWAITWDQYYWSFWFANEEDMVSFKLIWM